jgi:hypothetical protein
MIRQSKKNLLVLGLVETEVRGTRLFQNVSNYLPVGTEQSLRTLQYMIYVTRNRRLPNSSTLRTDDAISTARWYKRAAYILTVLRKLRQQIFLKNR